MTLALVGQGYWGSKISKECETLGIETEIFEINDNLSTITSDKYFGVIVATPAEDHVKSAIQLLKNKNNLLIEKPIAMNNNELLDLKKYITEEKIMVGHILIYNELYSEVKKQISNLKHIHVRRNAWGRFKRNITPILNLAPHDIALLDDIFQKQPISVYSHGVYVSGQSQPDTVFCFLDYDDVQVTLELGWYNHEKIREINFVCNDKHIVWNDVSKTIQIKELYLDQQARQQEGNSYTLNITEKKSPLQNQINAFQSYCLRNELPITNLSHAERVTKVVDALEQSLKENKKICL
jgi:predicted dehydrogenase